jgi:ribosomal protein S6--L-glutamate ligase
LRVSFIGKEAGPHSIYPRVCAELQTRGAEAATIVPERALFRMSDVAPQADLYVLRTRTLLGFSVAAALSLAGARLLVPLERERVVRSRFLVQQKLISASLPAPRAYMAASAGELLPTLRERGALILKPYEVSDGKAPLVVRSESELPREMQGPIFAQEFVPHTTADIKVYGIGSRIFAVRRRFPARTISEKLGAFFTPTREIVDLATRCREAFGLPLYGLDLIEGPDGLFVVDVNSTPGFKGVVAAAELIADLISGRLSEPLREAS